MFYYEMLFYVCTFYNPQREKESIFNGENIGG
jgi:hypothetical protein